MLHRDHLFILCILAGTWTDHYAVERLHQRRLHAGLLQRLGKRHWMQGELRKLETCLIEFTGVLQQNDSEGKFL